MRRTSFWNNITNKHYWPKTGRSSQKQNMYQKQSQNQIDPKTNYKIFLPKDINETTNILKADNVFSKTKYQTKFPTKISMKHLEQSTKYQTLDQLRRTSCWNNITNKHYWPKTGRSSQKKHVSKAISKTKLIQKQITKFPTKRYQWNILNR